MSILIFLQLKQLKSNAYSPRTKFVLFSIIQIWSGMIIIFKTLARNFFVDKKMDLFNKTVWQDCLINEIISDEKKGTF